MTDFPALPHPVSDLFEPEKWRNIPGFDFQDITYHRGVHRERDESGNVISCRDLPLVRIAFDRPEVRNAFRPETVDELYQALDHARLTGDVGSVILTGNGPSPKDGGWAFCSGGDQRVRGRDGYRYSKDGEPDPVRAGRLHILEVQRLIRSMPKVVIAAIPGWSTGGGHSLGVVCDLAVASKEHARFKQVDANVGSFDAGYGSQLLARQVGGSSRKRNLLPRARILRRSSGVLGSHQRVRNPLGFGEACTGVRRDHCNEVAPGNPDAQVHFQCARRGYRWHAGLCR